MLSSELGLRSTGNSPDQNPGGRDTPAAMPWICLRSTWLVGCKERWLAKSAGESGPFGLFVSGEISEQHYKQFITK